VGLSAATGARGGAARLPRTRRVRSVRGVGRGVSDQYGGRGGAGRRAFPARSSSSAEPLMNATRSRAPALATAARVCTAPTTLSCTTFCAALLSASAACASKGGQTPVKRRSNRAFDPAAFDRRQAPPTTPARRAIGCSVGPPHPAVRTGARRYLCLAQGPALTRELLQRCPLLRAHGAHPGGGGRGGCGHVGSRCGERRVGGFGGRRRGRLRGERRG
jgi:hypothetical protein